jgi:hypothetical protein
LRLASHPEWLVPISRFPSFRSDFRPFAPEAAASQSRRPDRRVNMSAPPPRTRRSYLALISSGMM